MLEPLLLGVAEDRAVRVECAGGVAADGLRCVPRGLVGPVLPGVEQMELGEAAAAAGCERLTR